MENMENECREYAKRIGDELEAIYNGQQVNDDGEEVTLCDWLNDVLDYNITLSSTKTLLGLKIYVALGGPTCWVDTELGVVVCSWGADRGEYYINNEICNAINDDMADVLELDY